MYNVGDKVTIWNDAADSHYEDATVIQSSKSYLYVKWNDSGLLKKFRQKDSREVGYPGIVALSIRLVAASEQNLGSNADLPPETHPGPTTEASEGDKPLPTPAICPFHVVGTRTLRFTSEKPTAEEAPTVREPAKHRFVGQGPNPQNIDKEPAKPANSKWKLSEKIGNKVDRAGVDNAPHLIVEALAGTGKTTTLIEGLKLLKGYPSGLLPSPQQAAVWEAMEESRGKIETACFVAFNKSIKEELEKRVPVGFSAMTMHGMGFKSVLKAFPGVTMEPHRVQNIISEILEKDIRQIRRETPVLLKATEDLVGLCKQNLVGTDTVVHRGDWFDAEGFSGALSQLAAHYDVELENFRERVFALVPRVLERCKDIAADRCLDFNDMIWLPVALDLPCYKYDVLLWDEAQDGNKCQQQLAMKCGRRLILCGDANQAIYGFAGADSESLPNMYKALSATDRGCVRLPLTVTRRCGKAIVKEAQKIVPAFEAFEANPEGKIGQASYCSTSEFPTCSACGGPISKELDKDSAGNVRCLNCKTIYAEQPLNYRSQVKDGDFILCRNNAPLVTQVFRFIREGRKATIQGRDIGQGLIKLLKKFNATTLEELIVSLENWSDKEKSKELVQKNPSDNKLQSIQDRRDCLAAFIEESKTVYEIEQRIERVFSDTTTNGIRLSSVHRSKGLEASRVFLLMPPGAQLPGKAKSAWQQKQNTNLLYVAITRAIEELVYVR